MSESQAVVTLSGACFFFSETGTEGGWWAFQDERFTGVPAEHLVICSVCGVYWNKQQQPLGPPKPIDLRRVKEGHDRERHRIQSAKQRVRHQHVWQLAYPNGVSYYEGLHIIKNGDILTVFDPSDKSTVCWSGEAAFMEVNLFTTTVDGLWVHVLPECAPLEEWKVWFFEQYPAQLQLGPISMQDWERTRIMIEKKLQELGRI